MKVNACDRTDWLSCLVSNFLSTAPGKKQQLFAQEVAEACCLHKLSSDRGLSLCSQQTFACSATTCKGFHSTLHCLCKMSCQSLSLPLPLDFDFDFRLLDCVSSWSQTLDRDAFFGMGSEAFVVKLGCAIPNIC